MNGTNVPRAAVRTGRMAEFRRACALRGQAPALVLGALVGTWLSCGAGDPSALPFWGLDLRDARELKTIMARMRARSGGAR